MRCDEDHTQTFQVRSSKGRIGEFRPSLISLAIMAAVLLSSCGKEKQVGAAAPVPEVEVTPVVQQDVPLYAEYISTLDGYINAQIQSQVTGYLLRQNYSEGTIVHKGDVLFDIDPRPFQAALEQAKGQLAQAQAQLGKTKLDVERVAFKKDNRMALAVGNHCICSVSLRGS